MADSEVISAAKFVDFLGDGVTVKTWLGEVRKIIDTLDAELIICEVLGYDDRTEIVLNENRKLSDSELVTLGEKVERRRNGEPLAYILGHRDFYGRRFLVNSDVLIPRVETEDCVEMVCAQFGGRKCTILDVGTGSGCIGVTLGLEIPEARVVCLDISEKALGIARKNARRLGAKNVEFLSSDLLSAYRGEKPDVIVAHLPYVDRSWDWVSPELKYEPELALFATEGGLTLIRELLDNISRKWYNGSNDSTVSIYLEADPSQHAKIVSYAKKLGFKHIKNKNYIIQLEL